MRFYTNLRYYQNQGYLYGRDQFDVTDFAAEAPNSGGADYMFVGTDGNNYFLLDPATTDEYVSLNPLAKYFGQFKLTYVIGGGMKLSYNFIGDKQVYQDYSSGAKLTPDNNLQRFRDASTHILSFNHAVSNSSFYTINASYFDKSYHHYLFEEISNGTSTQYVDNTFHQTPAYSFNVGGTDNNRFERYTKTFTGKFDWVSQITQQVNLQFGADYKKQEIYYHDINLVPVLDENGQRATPYNVEIPPLSSVDNNEYLHNPAEFSGYAQVKIEAFNMIINAGLRWGCSC
jgi:hypothetical protein